MWDKLSWKEVIIISIIALSVMLFIKVEVATYNIECDNGSIEEIEPGTNYGICGNNIVELNPYTGFVQVTPGNYGYEFNITGAEK